MEFCAEEPLTNGKIIIHTTYGPLEVELWCRECPLFTRNFIQLCLEGYYDYTKFHRIIPGFLLQAGDPSGTGSGGESVNGEAIPPEYHMHLKWNRRGLLGVAGINDKNEGSSQFFLTLSSTPQLYKKATLFGKIVGDTIFNLVRMGELPLEQEDDKECSTFLNPPQIIRIQVVLNPFEDIIPRELEEVRLRREEANKQNKKKESTTQVKRPESSKGTKKNLSFGDEDEDFQSMAFKKSIKSIHEVLTDDPTLSKSSVLESTEISSKPSRLDQSTTNTSDTLVDWKSNINQTEQSKISEIKSKINKVQNELFNEMSAENHQLPGNGKSSLPAVALKADSLSRLLGVKKRVADGEPTESKLHSQVKAFKDRPKMLKGKQGKSVMNEIDTFLALNHFREKLKKIDSECKNIDPVNLPSVEPSKQLDICRLHGLVNCESCRNTFGIVQDVGGEEGWLMHRLVFDKEVGYREMQNDLDQLKVIDPRERAALSDSKKNTNV